MQEIQVDIRTNQNSFKRPICPYLFKNANIYMLDIFNYENDYLFKNQIRFYDIDNKKMPQLI